MANRFELKNPSQSQFEGFAPLIRSLIAYPFTIIIICSGLYV